MDIGAKLSQSEMGYASQGIAPRRMNTRETLVARKEELERYLQNINNAIEALDQNPNVEKVLDLLSKV